MEDILKDLNPPQRDAVSTINGPLMVIAGAGSGKTRVLTYRIAYMIQQGIDSFSIMALTFTNKAAKEMKERIVKAVGATEGRNVWMGTFHSIFARILRLEAQNLGFTSNFTIYDTDDSKALISQIIKDMGLDPKTYDSKSILSRISAAKTALYSAQDYKDSHQLQEEDLRSKRPYTAEIFSRYNQKMHRSNAMDFDDILYFTNVLFRDFPEILYKYQQRFKYILVDEYQDTNYSQYLIIRKLSAMFENICVVGDDAQSIYAFRGANIKNILNFKNDYPDQILIRLEQNYRSTQNIVNAANSVIKNNKDQIKKKVWSDNEVGELITIHHAASDKEEGMLIANSIFEYKMSRQLCNKDFAILYRTNAQSRSIEEALRKRNIPYIIYGGLSFYDRKEVKDLLAYFRVVINPNDEQALLRIINYPVRGIGKTTINELMIEADRQNTTIWQCMTEGLLPDKLASNPKLQMFCNMIQGFQSMQKRVNAYDLAMHIAKETTIMEKMKSDTTPEGVARLQNIEELLNAIMEFSDRQVDETTGEQAQVDLVSFMEEVALLSDTDKKDDGNDDKVSMMTIHSSKGLEFPYVYIAGLEENLFPSLKSLDSRSDLEEERRLFYVALTRAEKKIVLTHSAQRYRWGNLTISEPSRFIEEISSDLIEKTSKASFKGTATRSNEPARREFRSISRPSSAPSSPTSRPGSQSGTQQKSDFAASDPDLLREGQRVEHQLFGIGTIICIEGMGANKKAAVDFDNVGRKQLMLKFAKLKILS